MPIDPEVYSRLTNALQTASVLAEQRLQRAQGEVMEADDLFESIRNAVEAARQLRVNGKEQK